jgi:hypothetical protein
MAGGSCHLKDENFVTMGQFAPPSPKPRSLAIQRLGQLVQEPVQVLIGLPLLFNLID